MNSFFECIHLICMQSTDDNITTVTELNHAINDNHAQKEGAGEGLSII